MDRTLRIPRLAVTPGEPAGIGPDICLSVAAEPDTAELVHFCDPRLIEERASQLGVDIVVNAIDKHGYKPGAFNVQPVMLDTGAQAGQLNPANADYVLQCLDQAVSACNQGSCHGLVTAPVNKAVINDAGIAFTGHTEWLAERTGAGRVVMMLTGGDMRVALATTHLPLSAVPAAITPTLLIETITILRDGLIENFAIEQPTILVCGLNPHAGEAGHLGREEIDVIEPVVLKLIKDGFRLIGPLPADTAFTPDVLEGTDAVLVMFHDQGLPVLKHASFGQAVNVTLGLPIVRTSVDHGTALDIAGSGKADPGSLKAAIRCANDIAIRKMADDSTT